MSKPIRHGNKWRIRWTDENGKRCSETHGRKADAQLALTRALVEVEERKRGLRALVPRSCTFREAASLWMEVVGSGKRSRVTDQSFLRVHLLPAFGDLQLLEINQESVAQYQRDPVRRHLTANTLHHHITLVITVLRFAHRQGLLDSLPRLDKPKVPIDEQAYRYLKTEDEIVRFLSAARNEAALLFALYAVPVYSGLRLGEVCGLRAEDVDLPHRVLHVRRSYDGPTKSGRARMVPILDALLPVLRAWINDTQQGLLFPNHKGGLLGRDAPYFRKARYLGRTLRAAGLPEDHITFHDLRHTFASHWMMNGGSLFKLQRILGHKSIETTQRYAHLAPKAFAEDYNRLSPKRAANLSVVSS